MISIIRPSIILILFLMGCTACDESFEDAIPKTFFMVQVNPDDIHMYNSGDENGLRLDPLVNDSIKVDVTISYSTPLFGSIQFIKDEGWFYKPNLGYYGLDNIIYTICYTGGCSSASITMYVEAPVDLNNCTFEINGESIETAKDAPIAIRIFENDTVCPYMGSSLSSPEKGRFETFSYSGTFKNIVYVYYPPKGYVGTDRFKYKLFTNGADIEAYCEITIK
jgi:hypothetical protein